MFKLVQFGKQLAKLHSYSRLGSNSLKTNKSLFWDAKMFYMTREIRLRNEASGYYLDPSDVARRLVKVISLHDKVKNPDRITLHSTFHDIGIDDLSFVEIFLEVEQEFFIEFPDDDLERFKTVQDAVEYIARSFYAA